MNSIFWKSKEIVTLVETVKESKLWIISNSKHNNWKQLDSKLKKSSGSSYKKFHSILKKFAETDEKDNWKYYDLMLTHFPHYAKSNQSSINSQLSSGGNEEHLLLLNSKNISSWQEDQGTKAGVISEINEDDTESVTMSEQNYWNDTMCKWRNDPDQVFIAELYRNMKELDDEMKSLFKIKAQLTMHSLKYNKLDP